MRSTTWRNALWAISKTKSSTGWPNSNADTISIFAINHHGRTACGLLRLRGVPAVSATCSTVRNATTGCPRIFLCNAFRSARTSRVFGHGMTIMDFSRTRAALAAYHRVMDEGPTFGNSPGRVERWDRACLTAAAAAREAFYTEAAGEYTREECGAMELTRLQALIDESERPPPSFTRTLQAIDAYYDERKAGPQSSPGELGVKAWASECAIKIFDVRDTFCVEAGGRYTREECVRLRVEEIQAMIADWSTYSRMNFEQAKAQLWLV